MYQVVLPTPYLSLDSVTDTIYDTTSGEYWMPEQKYKLDGTTLVNTEIIVTTDFQTLQDQGTKDVNLQLGHDSFPTFSTYFQYTGIVIGATNAIFLRQTDVALTGVSFTQSFNF